MTPGKEGRAGFNRPSLTTAAGLLTENGTRGVAGADLRQRLDDRLQYRLGPSSHVWGGLSYMLASTEVAFDAPPETPGLPAFGRSSRVGGLTPSLTYDSRDSTFTPGRGIPEPQDSRQVRSHRVEAEPPSVDHLVVGVQRLRMQDPRHRRSGPAPSAAAARTSWMMQLT